MDLRFIFGLHRCDFLTSEVLADLQNLVRAIRVLQHRLPKTGWCRTIKLGASVPSGQEVYPPVAFYRRGWSVVAWHGLTYALQTGELLAAVATMSSLS
jgi:hypothetical protein